MSPAVELRGPQAVQNYDARFWEITPKSGSHVTRRWSEGDSNCWSPVKGTASFETTLAENQARGTEGSNPLRSSAESSSILDTSATNRLGVAAPLLAKVL